MNIIKLNSTGNNTGVILQSALPREVQTKKTSSTLGGGMFVQQIGDPIPMLDIIITATWDQRVTFNDYCNNVTELKIEWEGTYYVGYITTNTLKWNMINRGAQSNRKYESVFEFHYTSSGAVV